MEPWVRIVALRSSLSKNCRTNAAAATTAVAAQVNLLKMEADIWLVETAVGWEVGRVAALPTSAGLRRDPLDLP